MERQFAALLDEFRKLPPAVSRPPTFMEVAGYPHYENVCSNMLAFFFDPNNPHGFGSLLLGALAEAGSIESITDGAYANVSVERELTTDAGNRIDILIESDTLLIGIENKIFQAAANPFADYATFIKQRNINGKTTYKFLLTLEPSNAGIEYGFMNLTYPRFINAIRQRVGYGVAHAHMRYLVLLLDFLNTLENI
jgi:PD-(D/E)XK nuclease superfamily